MSGLFGSDTTISTSETALSGLVIQTSAYGVTIPITYGKTRVAPNLIWYGNFQAIPRTTTQSSGGKGGSVTSSNTTYTYTAGVILALGEGPIVDVKKAWIDKSVYADPSAVGLSKFLGSYPQSPWGWLTTNVPAQALGYSGIAYVANSALACSSSASIGNHGYEVAGRLYDAYNIDVNQADIITDFLTNANYGVPNFSSGKIGDLAQLTNYCNALGIRVSPELSTQRAAHEWLTEWAQSANAGLVWSEGKLKIVPYSDLAASGYYYVGSMQTLATYTPSVTPAYDLTDDDFIVREARDPVMVTRKRQADAFNCVQVEYRDRSTDYNVAVAEVKDQANIEAYGLRTMPVVKMHLLTSKTAAMQVAQAILQRALYIRNEYKFDLTWKYSRLEPMDVVTITDAQLGLNQARVRITEVDESADGLLTVTAEEFPNGVTAANTYAGSNGSGYLPNYNAAPPNTNAPLIFAPPIEIATSTLEMWVAACGNAGWGGCEVWVSSDNSTYSRVGRIQGNARMGTLTANLPSSSDPDTTHTLAVDLTMSAGSMLSGTKGDADLFHTLCYADGELISYQTAALTSAYHYDLKDYIRRGAYGSPIGAHLSGTKFARLDEAIFSIPYTADQIGSTMYVKLPAFNVWQGGMQSLVDVSPATVVIPSPPAPANVQNFAAQQSGNVVVFSWHQVVDYALKGYDIGYAAQGETDWAHFILLTESARGTEMTNAAVPPGTWVFGIRARDVVGQLSPSISTFNLIVTTSSPVIASARQDPDWSGVTANMVKHVSGVLIPAGTKTCDQYQQLTAPAAPTLSSIAGGTMNAATYYAKATYTTASGETLASSEASLAVAANSLLKITSPITSNGATGWNAYVSLTTGNETKQTSTPLAIGVDWTEPIPGLVSGANLPVSNTTGWEPFDLFVVDPVPTCSYTTPTIDTMYDSTLRVYSTDAVVMGYGQSGTPQHMEYFDSWLSAGSDPNNYLPWLIGQASFRYMKMRIALTSISLGTVPIITAFTAFADTQPIIENVASAAVSPGGTTVTFPQRYHIVPFVMASVVGATALYATVSNITPTGCDIHIFNSSGTDVGGTATYTATGS